MPYIADLHIHSCFSRATSKNMVLPNLVIWAKKKGLSLLGTGDFTHPGWFKELKRFLKPSNRYGIWSYEGIDFLFSCEVNNIFSRRKRGYRIHTLILAPNFDEVSKINEYLRKFGRLDIDGRPILNLDIERMCSSLLKIAPNSFVIFAHIWTPWYSLFGKNSGFDSINEAFPSGICANVLALETGLSSDPGMNWRVSQLDSLSLVSNSDAHSPANLGREANVFSGPIDFEDLKQILSYQDKTRFLFTIEFFPEEGKYHYDGHRNCGLCLHPIETNSLGGVCPKCGKNLTIGVLHRVYDLADRESVIKNGPSNRIPYYRLIPLAEIISDVKGKSKNSKAVQSLYEKLTNIAPEFDWLLFFEPEKLFSLIPKELAEAILLVRNEKVQIQPGYDGVYGKISFDNDLSHEDEFNLF